METLFKLISWLIERASFIIGYWLLAIPFFIIMGMIKSHKNIKEKTGFSLKDKLEDILETTAEDVYESKRTIENDIKRLGK